LAAPTDPLLHVEFAGHRFAAYTHGSGLRTRRGHGLPARFAVSTQRSLPTYYYPAGCCDAGRPRCSNPSSTVNVFSGLGVKKVVLFVRDNRHCCILLLRQLLDRSDRVLPQFAGADFPNPDTAGEIAGLKWLAILWRWSRWRSRWRPCAPAVQRLADPNADSAGSAGGFSPTPRTTRPFYGEVFLI